MRKKSTTTEKFVLAGHLFNCVKCQQCFGRLNKMDSSGEISGEDCSMDDYKRQAAMMEERVKHAGVKLLTTFLEGVTCNKCLFEK